MRCFFLLSHSPCLPHIRCLLLTCTRSCSCAARLPSERVASPRWGGCSHGRLRPHSARNGSDPMVNHWRRLLLLYLGFRHLLQSSLHSVQWFGAVVLKPEGLRRQHESMLVLLVRLSVTVVCYYSWVSVRLPSSSTWLVRLNGDWTWHNCNRLVLGTERTRLVWGDDQSVVSFHICWPRSSNASKSSVRSSRSRSKYTFFNLGESTRSGLNDTCCEQLRVPFLATTLLV